MITTRATDRTAEAPIIISHIRTGADVVISSEMMRTRKADRRRTKKFFANCCPTVRWATKGHAIDHGRSCTWVA